ncbi:MAG: arginase family protein, partial [Chloroflexi bacterium]|nr:arginase family protein [Chloroflexota bacterium]
MQSVVLLSVPFNQDKHLSGMGNAPQALFDAGLLERLAAIGVHVEYTEEVENNLGEGEMLTRLGRLQNIVCDDVYDALKKNLFPLILGGDCCNALGMWGGLTHALARGWNPKSPTSDNVLPARSARGASQDVESYKIGVVWFDAHGDWNTEETSLSHYIGGMPYAAICGYGNKKLRDDVGITHAAQTDHCVLIGARDLDKPEEALMKTTHLTVLPPDQARRDLSAAKKVLERVDAFYLHFDIDALDLTEAPGVNYPAPNGLTSDEAIRMVR